MTPLSTELHEDVAQSNLPPIPKSGRGDWTWELVTQFPRQGEWTEEEYLSREFEGKVEFSHGVLDFIGPLYPPDAGGPPHSRRGDWTWELVTEFPRQGEWTEGRYLQLESNRLIEFTHGVLEFLPMPKFSHARIARYLSDLLRACVEVRRLGEVFWAPMSIRLNSGVLREPDVLWLRPDRTVTDDVPDGADLVMEVVSGDTKDRRRDYSQKRKEYAEGRIPEYWIVDPRDETITVLTLPAGATEYTTHGEFRTGQQATSVVLPDFTVDVTECFAAGNPV